MSAAQGWSTPQSSRVGIRGRALRVKLLSRLWLEQVDRAAGGRDGRYGIHRQGGGARVGQRRRCFGLFYLVALEGKLSVTRQG